MYQFAGVAPNTVIDPEPVKLEIQRIYTEADAPRRADSYFHWSQRRFDIY